MPSGKHDIGNLDDAWAAFEAEHQADLNDVASSRQAKKFEKQAKKREKEALLSVDDLDIGSFTDDARPDRGRKGGPRDFTGSGWLDTDNVMDAYDDGGFTPRTRILARSKRLRCCWWRCSSSVLSAKQ